MIEASFDRLSKRAAIDGVFQYDTGQRLRLSGLPSPGEMSAADDFLGDSDLAAVQVQFGRDGDSQAQTRLAQWDIEHSVWLCDLPDEYLTSTESVNVYVYVSHGVDDGGSRNRTMYAGVFTPIGRPAPNNVATDDQLQTWDGLKEEVSLVLVTVQTAQGNAQAAADDASNAAEAARKAAEDTDDAYHAVDDALYRLESLSAKWESMNIRAIGLSPGAEATATIDDSGIVLGIPKGKKGPDGDSGKDGPTDIDLSFSNGVLTITPR